MSVASPQASQTPAARAGVIPSLAQGSVIGAYQAFINLEERARAAKSVRELLFSAANESWQITSHRQSFLWDCRSDGSVKLRVVSGVAQLTEDSPFTVWLKRLGQWIASKPEGTAAQYLSIDDVPANLKDGWTEWLPSFLFIAPIFTPDSGIATASPSTAKSKLPKAFLAFALDDGLSETQADLVQRLMDVYGHAWAGLLPKASRFSQVASGARRIKRWALPLLALIAIAAMFIPIRLSALASGEIVALDAAVVSAPIDGVVKTFHVQPNQAVKKNQALFTLDDTSLRNRREVSLKQLQVARADAMAAQQKAFENDASRAELASLNGKVAEKQAELASVEDQLKRIEVVSPADGVVVFGDINDWLGKPVNTGERVALLADPKDAGVLIWLPVSEAINLEPGAQIKLYLQVAPLKPLVATLTQTSYQAVMSPDGISAYRLRGQLKLESDDQKALARIGLKGTAKIYGEQAPLGYYFFRRPLAALRELTGW